MRRARMLAATLLGLAIVAAPAQVRARSADYAFEPVKADVKNGVGSELAVRIMHKPTRKPVGGAVLTSTRLDMSPDNMGMMTAKHAALPATEPGVYRFRADLTMAGRWAFKIMAKVPGEAEAIEAIVVFRAK